MQPPNDKLLRPGEVAKMFGVCTDTIVRWARDGKLTPVVTPGGHHRYSETAIRALLGQDTPEQTAEEKTGEDAPDLHSQETPEQTAERLLGEDAARLYDQGWTIQQLADRFGRGYGAMHRILHQHTTLRSPGPRPSARK